MLCRVVIAGSCVAFVAAAGCVSDYNVAFYNASAERLTGMRALDVPQLAGGVLIPGALSVTHEQIPPVPEKFTLAWETPDGASHTQVVPVVMSPAQRSRFGGTLYLTYANGTFVAVPRPSKLVWDDMRSNPP